MSKIFGIGLSKTGTTSLAASLKILGFKTKDFPSLQYFPHRLIGIKKDVLHAYDAFTDLPVVPFYKDLDVKFPDSKFILTLRDKESWLESCRKYPRFRKPLWKLPFKIIKLRQKVYGTAQFDEGLYSDAFDKHLEDVNNYFKGREDDLLKINIVNGHGWEPICEFLDKPVPQNNFPFKNSRKHNYDGHFG